MFLSCLLVYRLERENPLLLVRRFLSGVGGGVIPDGLARERPPVGCLERLIVQDLHFLDVVRLR